MSVNNSRQVSTKTLKMLWGLAASRCAFPDCRRELVINHNSVDNASLLGEACHIVAKEPNGPRGNSPLTSKERDEYENLLLLCNIHHKLIDDQPNTFPISRLQEMKSAHEKWVRDSLQGTYPIWYVPYQRNPLFTGRENLLDMLHDKLTITKSATLTQPQAISGLGGIGKTQIALEYAYSYRGAYHAIFWINATNRDLFVLDVVKIATLLQIPHQEEQDQNIIIEAVKNWFVHNSDWLLILDNADDLTIVSDFLPIGNRGHILLTTRSQATGTIARRIEVEKMDQEESTLLLLRRAKVIQLEGVLKQATKEKQSEAEAIIKELDGLPLALDQAGAYIEETSCGLSGYLYRYQTQREKLLKRRGNSSYDHPESVATTWSLSFEKIKQTNQFAAELLQFLAFLAPDAIQEEIITQGAFYLNETMQLIINDPFVLDEAISVLCTFSLINRNSDEKVLSIHRLVQAVLKDQMTEVTQRQWAKDTVNVINHVFPDVTLTNWYDCQRYLPHAQICAIFIQKWQIYSEEAVDLLGKLSHYLQDSASYTEAEIYYFQELKAFENVFGAESYLSAIIISDISILYYDMGDYIKAEEFSKRALALLEQDLGSEHLAVGLVLNDLALLYRNLGKYDQAEILFKRAATILEKMLGPYHPKRADNIKNLALLYYTLGKYEQAESLYQQALAILENCLNPVDPALGALIGTIAELYREQGKYERAEPLYQRALIIAEHSFGPDHPKLAIHLNNIALLYYNQNKYEQAEPLFKRSLSIFEGSGNSYNPRLATNMNNLALIYRDQGKYEQAEPLFKRALDIQSMIFGPEHPDTANTLNNLAKLYHEQEKYDQAELLYKQAVANLEKSIGKNHSDVSNVLGNLAALYYEQNKYNQAEPLLKRAIAIRKKTFGDASLIVADSTASLALVYQALGKYEQSELLYRNALTIQEQCLGLESFELSIHLNNLAIIYYEQNKYSQAEPLFKRVVEMQEQNLGPDDLLVAISSNNLALVYHLQRKYEQAKPFYKNALRISEKLLGSEHPDVKETLMAYKRLLFESSIEIDTKKFPYYKQQTKSEAPFQKNQGHFKKRKKAKRK